MRQVFRRPGAPAPATSEAVVRYDLGGALAQVVPAVQLPYIHVQKAQKVPLNLSDIKEKYKTQSEEALGKALKSTDDLWNDTMKNLNLLPHQKAILNERRTALQQDLYQKVSTNPTYFANPANLLEISHRMQNLVHNADIDAMKFKTKEVEDWAGKIQATPELASRVARDEHGAARYDPETGEKMTNQRYLELLKTSTDPRLYRDLPTVDGKTQANLLNIDGTHPVGRYNVGSWTGTMGDATKEVDGWGALAQASGWKKGRGGYGLAPLSDEQKLKFGTQYDALQKYQQTQGGETNSSALATIVKSLTKGGWEKALSKPAVEGLKDHFDQAYDENSFGEIFSKTALVDKAGKAVPSAYTVAQVALMARRGMLKDGEKVLDQIEQQRGRYVNSRATRFIMDRVGARGYNETTDEYDTSLDLNTTGGTGENGENNNEVADADDGLGSRYAEQVPQADQTSGNGIVTQLKVPFSNATKTQYTEFYAPKGRPAPSVLDISSSGGQPVYLPGSANQNIGELFGLRGSDGAAMTTDGLSTQAILGKMKVLGYNTAVRVPKMTPGSQSAQLNEQLAKAAFNLRYEESQLNRLQNLPGHAAPSTSDVQQRQQKIAQLQASYQGLRTQLMSATDAEKTPIRHEVNVVMRLADFQAMNDRFASRSTTGEVNKPFGSRWGIPGLPESVLQADLTGKQDPKVNPHNVRYFDKENTQTADRERLGFSKDEELVQFPLQVQQPLSEAYSGGKKGMRNHTLQGMVNQRRGELQRHVGAAIGSLSGK